MSTNHDPAKEQIFTALNKIMQDIPAVPKSHRVEFGQTKYNFRGIDDIYQVLQPLLVKYKVCSVPEVVKSDLSTVETKNGVANRVVLTIKYTFYAEDGSSVGSCVIGEGIDSGDKASNKAMSAGHKYALLQVLCIPTAEAKDSELEHHEVQKKSIHLTGAITAQSGSKNSIISPSAQTSPSQQKTSSSSSEAEVQDSGDYVITFGKHKNKTIRELVDLDGPQKVGSYIRYLEGKAKEDGKPLGQAAADFVEAFDCYTQTTELDKALDGFRQTESMTEKIKKLDNKAPQHVDSDGAPWPDNP